MRTLKIVLVMVFCLAPLTPTITTRVAALTATLAQGKAPKEKPGFVICARKSSRRCRTPRRSRSC